MCSSQLNTRGIIIYSCISYGASTWTKGYVLAIDIFCIAYDSCGLNRL